MAAFFCISTYAAESVLLNGTAAVVGNTLITVQDAYFYRSIQRFKEGNSQLLNYEKGDDLRRTVQKMMFEEMVFSEMKSFQFEGASRGEAEKALVKQKTKGRDKLWKNVLSHFKRSESEAIDRIWKSLRVERFIQKKVETLTPIITESEVERYYKQNQERFKGSQFDAMKPNIIVMLKKQRMEKGLEEWVRFLRDKYGVTNHLGS